MNEQIKNNLERIKPCLPRTWTDINSYDWDQFANRMNRIGIPCQKHQIADIMGYLTTEGIVVKDGVMFMLNPNPERHKAETLKVKKKANLSKFDSTVFEIGKLCEQWLDSENKRGKEFKFISMIQEKIDLANKLRQ